MELTLTGASLSSDAAISSSVTNSKSKNTNANVNEDSHANSDTNANVKAKAKSCQESSVQGQGQKQCNSNSGSHGNSHSHSHSHSHGACCSNNQISHQDFSQFHSVPFERLLANPTGLFGAIIEVIKNGPFDTFEYLADSIVRHEKKTGVALVWGNKVDEDSNNKAAITTTTDAAGAGSAGGTAATNNKQTHESSLLNRTPEGHTLVHWAAKRGNDIRFIEYLSKLTHANLHIPSSDAVGMYPIHWAAIGGFIPIISFILKHSNSTSGYATTSSSSVLHHSQLHDLHQQNTIDQNDPINARDKSSCTPLLIAAQYGHAGLSAFLIKRGADPNAVDHSSDTALHWAAYKGAVPVCGLLLYLNGIENQLDLQDAFGQTPIHLASLRGNVDVVQYLMDQAEGYVDKKMHGIDVGLGATINNNINTNDNNNTAAISSYNTTIDKFPQQLLQTTDKDGKTPLDLAVKKKKIACEVVLREYMDNHCNPDRSLWGKIKQNVKPFCSCTNWKTWIGIAPDHGRVKHSPRFVFWFVFFNVNLATLVEFFIYAPLSFKHGIGGRLGDSSYLPLHLMTMFFLISTYASLITVNRTDPGRLAVTGFAASNTVAPSSCPTVGSGRLCSSLFGNSFGGILGNIINMAVALYASLCGLVGGSREHSIVCGNENGQIRREMEQLTRELQNQYEETLENFATEDELVNGSLQPPSLCHSCHIAKPLRSKHCRVLNQCVLLFDHHCPFVGTTIGLYNYRYFYLFVFCMTVSEVLFGITGILYLRHPTDADGGHEFKMIFLAIYLAFYGLLSGGLCVYHTQLIQLNLTTNEHANIHRFKYLSYDNATGNVSNPFNKGFVKNFIGRFKPWKGSYMLAFCNDVPCKEMEPKEKKKDEDEIEDLMLNVV